MPVKRYLAISVLLSAAVLPVIIGASCPPPSMPYIASIGSNRVGITTEVPECSPGFVCISIVNTAYIDVEVSLYIHDGFDLDLNYCQESRPEVIGGTPVFIAEYCPGYNLGEFQVSRPQLFDAANRYDIDDIYDVRTIRALEEAPLIRLQEGDIKTFGIEIGQTGTMPDDPEIQNGPYYRCTLVNLGSIRVPRSSEHVPTGETFQFVIYDESGGVVPGLAQLAVTTATSSTGGCPAVQ